MKQHIIFKQLLLITLCLCYFSTSAKLDTLAAYIHTQQGDSLARSRAYQQAISQFEKACNIYKEHKAWQRYYYNINKIGRLYNNLSKPKEAQQTYATHINDSLNKIPALEKAVALSGEAWAYTIMGQSDQAIKKGQKAVDIIADGSVGSIIDQGKIINTLGVTYYYADQIDKAATQFKRAIKLFEDNDLNDRPELGSYYNGLASIVSSKGQHKQSLEIHQKALRLQLKTRGEQNQYVADVYRNIGSDYFDLNLPYKALEYFNKALDIRLKLFDENHQKVISTYEALAVAYDAIDELDQAQKYHEKTIQLFEKNFGTKHPKLYQFYGNYFSCLIDQKKHKKVLELGASLLSRVELNNKERALINMNLGIANADTKNYQQAIFHQNEAVKFVIGQFGEKHPQLSIIYNDIADAYYNQKAFDSALVYYQKSLVNNMADFNDMNPTSTPTSLSYSNFKPLLLGVRKKIDIFLQQNPSNDEASLKPALENLAFANKVLANEINKNTSQSDKTRLVNEARYLNTEGIMLLQRVAGSNADYLNNILQNIETIKSVNLKVTLGEHEALQYGDVPNDLIEKEEDVKKRLSTITQQIYQKKLKKEAIEDLENQKFQLQKSLDSLVNLFEKTYPNYFELKYATPITNVADVQKSLEPQQAILAYYIDTKGQVFYFTISKNGQSFEKLQPVEDVPTDVSSFLKSLDIKQVEADPIKAYKIYAQQAYKFYQFYLEKPLSTLPEDTKQLFIIQDGTLGYIPFGLALTAPANLDVLDYKSLPYLIKDYQISYAHSISLLLRDFNFQKNSSANGLLAFAPSYPSLQESIAKQSDLRQFKNELSDLVWNREEVTKVKDIFNGEAFLNQEATESKFKAIGNNYGVIHLAMHALVDEKSPMYSKLLFSQTDVDSLEDGSLNAYELYDLKLNANLAVLSACNTGYGKLVRGEGLMSLARAFAFAGCPSIVMSHWKVDDKSTSELMPLFYNGLSSGMGKAEALQQAKLQFIEQTEAKFAHPFYWGSFVMIGKDDPISTNSNWWLYGLLGLGILTALFFITRKK